MCYGGMYNGAISNMREMMVKAMEIIGGNSLKNLLLILISIAHSSSILWILSMLMITYRGGMDRVAIGSIGVFQCLWQMIGSWRMGRISRILHAGGQVL